MMPLGSFPCTPPLTNSTGPDLKSRVGYSPRILFNEAQPVFEYLFQQTLPFIKIKKNYFRLAVSPSSEGCDLAFLLIPIPS
jgi:hypothetical protein